MPEWDTGPAPVADNSYVPPAGYTASYSGGSSGPNGDGTPGTLSGYVKPAGGSFNDVLSPTGQDLGLIDANANTGSLLGDLLPIALIAISIIAPELIPELGQAIAGAVGAGEVSGSVAAAIGNTAISTGIGLASGEDIGTILKNDVLSAVGGGISSEVSNAAGGGSLGNAIGSASSGAATAALTGGNIGQAALTGAIGSELSGAINSGLDTINPPVSTDAQNNQNDLAQVGERVDTPPSITPTVSYTPSPDAQIPETKDMPWSAMVRGDSQPTLTDANDLAQFGPTPTDVQTQLPDAPTSVIPDLYGQTLASKLTDPTNVLTGNLNDAPLVGQGTDTLSYAPENNTGSLALNLGGASTDSAGKVIGGGTAAEGYTAQTPPDAQPSNTNKELANLLSGGILGSLLSSPTPAPSFASPPSIDASTGAPGAVADDSALPGGVDDPSKPKKNPRYPWGDPEGTSALREGLGI